MELEDESWKKIETDALIAQSLEDEFGELRGGHEHHYPGNYTPPIAADFEINPENAPVENIGENGDFANTDNFTHEQLEDLCDSIGPVPKGYPERMIHDAWIKKNSSAFSDG